MLQTNLMSLDEYIKTDRMQFFYTMSAFFRDADFNIVLNMNNWSIERLLDLSERQLYDLTALLALNGGYTYCRSKQPEVWLEEGYLNLDLFLQCRSIDRWKYMEFMYYAKTPKNNFTLEHFLSFRESTRKHYQHGNHFNLITIGNFDNLSEELQASIEGSFFDSIVGLRAIDCNFITLEQYCNISSSARRVLYKELFYIWDKDRPFDTDDQTQKLNTIIKNGFDLEVFDYHAMCSEKHATQYFYDVLYDRVNNIEASLL